MNRKFSRTQQAGNAMPLPSSVLQRKCAVCGQHSIAGGECEGCKKKRLMRSAASQAEPMEVPPIVHMVLRSSGQPLDAATRAFMEPRFGLNFSHVLVHTDRQAAESAQAVNALAYTVGRNVVFGAGRYRPGTIEGKRLLAHELTHVAQGGTSRGGAVTNLTLGSKNDASETEAEQVALEIDGGGSHELAPGTGRYGLVTGLPMATASTGRIQRQPQEPGQQASRNSAGESSDPTLWEVTKQCLKDLLLPNLIARLTVILACLTGFIAGPEAAPVVWACLKITGLVITLTQVIEILTCIGARYFRRAKPVAAPGSEVGSGETAAAAA